VSDLSRPTEPAASGVIYDIGYQGYDGPRLGRRNAVIALYIHGLRGVFGLGRPAKSKVLPWLVVTINFLPVIVLVAVMSRAGTQVERYDFYPFQLQAPLAVFLAAQAPELLSRDQRYQVLPLYFSRPIRRSDYALAKLAAMITALFAVIAAPLLVYYLGSVATVTHNAGQVRHQTAQFALGTANALVYAVVLGALGMAIAAFARRRAFATAAVIAVYIITAAISGALGSLQGSGGRYAQLVAPFELVDGVRVWLLHGKEIHPIAPAGSSYAVAAAALVVVCVFALLRRYRRIAT
jgi:ABC-2 type transport system permease protein